jgi:hypothetical protein
MQPVVTQAHADYLNILAQGPPDQAWDAILAKGSKKFNANVFFDDQLEKAALWTKTNVDDALLSQANSTAAKEFVSFKMVKTVSSKDRLEVEKVKAALGGKPTTPIAIRVDDELLIIKGHEDVVAAMSQGLDGMEMRVLNLSKKAPSVPVTPPVAPPPPLQVKPPLTFASPAEADEIVKKLLTSGKLIGDTYDLEQAGYLKLKLLKTKIETKAYELKLNGKDQAADHLQLSWTQLDEAQKKLLPGAPPTPTIPTPPPPAPSMGFPASISEVKFVKGLGGSTGAELVEWNGKQFVRKQGASAAHLKSEAAADRLYQAVGMQVPDFRLYEEGGKVYKLAEFQPGITLDKAAGALKTQTEETIRQGFAMDALLGNWDVVGLQSDNILIDGPNVFRIDNGGALSFRAQGAKKTADQWGATVNELQTMRTAKNAAGKIYGSVTDQQIVDQINTLILPNRKKILDAAALHSPNDLDILSKRIDYLENWAKTAVQTPAPQQTTQDLLNVGLFTKSEVNKLMPQLDNLTLQELEQLKAKIDQSVPILIDWNDVKDDYFKVNAKIAQLKTGSIPTPPAPQIAKKTVPELVQQPGSLSGLDLQQLTPSELTLLESEINLQKAKGVLGAADKAHDIARHKKFQKVVANPEHYTVTDLEKSLLYAKKWGLTTEEGILDKAIQVKKAPPPPPPVFQQPTPPPPPPKPLPVAVKPATTIKEAKETLDQMGASLIIDADAPLQLEISNSVIEAFDDLMNQGISVKGIPVHITKMPPTHTGYAEVKNGVLKIYADSPYWKQDPQFIAGLNAKNWFTVNSPKGIIQHEVGHFLHFQKDPNNISLAFGKVSKHVIKEAKVEVSAYATSNQVEFVAEVFTGLVNGKTFSPEVMKYYQKYGGPEVRGIPLRRGGTQFGRVPLPPQAYRVEKTLEELDVIPSQVFGTVDPLDHAARASRIKNHTNPYGLTDKLREATKQARTTFTSQELNALQDYTGYLYTDMNKLARKGIGAHAGTTANLVDHADRALDKSRLPVDLKVYRGTKFKSGFPPEYQNLQPGDVLTDWGIGSTSLDASVASSFSSSYGDAVIFEILAPAGSKGLYAKPFSQHKSEDEVMLPRGASLLVHSVTKSGTKLRVVAELLGG